MKKTILALLLVAVVMSFVGCSTTLPVNATSNEVGNKVGESTGVYLFNAIPLFGANSSISNAARNGGIKKISTVDQRYTTYFLWSNITTVVTGE